MATHNKEIERNRMLFDYRKPASASSIRMRLSSEAVTKACKKSRSSWGKGAVSVMLLPERGCVKVILAACRKLRSSAGEFGAVGGYDAIEAKAGIGFGDGELDGLEIGHVESVSRKRNPRAHSQE